MPVAVMVFQKTLCFLTNWHLTSRPWQRRLIFIPPLLGLRVDRLVGCGMARIKLSALLPDEIVCWRNEGSPITLVRRGDRLAFFFALLVVFNAVKKLCARFL